MCYMAAGLCPGFAVHRQIVNTCCRAAEYLIEQAIGPIRSDALWHGMQRARRVGLPSCHQSHEACQGGP